MADSYFTGRPILVIDDNDPDHRTVICGCPSRHIIIRLSTERWATSGWPAKIAEPGFMVTCRSYDVYTLSDTVAMICPECGAEHPRAWQEAMNRMPRDQQERCVVVCAQCYGEMVEP